MQIIAFPKTPTILKLTKTELVLMVKNSMYIAEEFAHVIPVLKLFKEE
jgi:hypothetical protein